MKFELKSMAVERKGRDEERASIMSLIRRECCGQLKTREESMKLSLGEEDQGGNMSAAQQGERGWRRSRVFGQSLKMGL